MTEEKLPVKHGLGTLDKPMTRRQADRYAQKAMPADLRRAGFTAYVTRSDPELHGGNWFRVHFAK